MQEKPLILVTNDDGITAPGIRALIKTMNAIGDVVVVAPDKAQSGMGHAITMDTVLTCNPITIDDGPQLEYTCSGTPADCVKMAINEVLNRKPDLCVSGINHGANSSINVIYSGTMGAAIEAGIEGVPAIGFSLLDYKWDADFEASEEYVKKIVLNALLEGIPEGVVLNVNIPDFKNHEIKGIKICRQANGSWKEKFDKRTSPFGKEYYWLSGEFVCKDKEQDTDIYALENGYVSVVPVQFDLTAHHMIQKLNAWEL
ncbi:acid phosphatase [Polaribacter irgensii 23-P]|uniref:5'-nucleotidase SurE n=1 Tax=Polaribacter irgensii 23-P TaxID=313594 RepID=A4C2L5_9FLAO|nr:5'/3'-nucleotidase SurE [Polaribacter irgensii]EAR11816.1 acid phosphatase [Polaribacter irgensii 23-P]